MLSIILRKHPNAEVKGDQRGKKGWGNWDEGFDHAFCGCPSRYMPERILLALRSDSPVSRENIGSGLPALECHAVNLHRVLPQSMCRSDRGRWIHVFPGTPHLHALIIHLCNSTWPQEKHPPFSGWCWMSYHSLPPDDLPWFSAYHRDNVHIIPGFLSRNQYPHLSQRCSVFPITTIFCSVFLPFFYPTDHSVLVPVQRFPNASDTHSTVVHPDRQVSDFFRVCMHPRFYRIIFAALLTSAALCARTVILCLHLVLCPSASGASLPFGHSSSFIDGSGAQGGNMPGAVMCTVSGMVSSLRSINWCRRRYVRLRAVCRLARLLVTNEIFQLYYKGYHSLCQHLIITTSSIHHEFDSFDTRNTQMRRVATHLLQKNNPHRGCLRGMGAKRNSTQRRVISGESLYFSSSSSKSSISRAANW